MCETALTTEEDKAYHLYEKGFCQSYSMNVTGKITAGFGKMYEDGEFEFPLVVNQKTHRIISRQELGKCY